MSKQMAEMSEHQVGDFERFVNESKEMDAAFLNGTLSEWVSRKREREQAEFFREIEGTESVVAPEGRP